MLLAMFEKERIQSPEKLFGDACRRALEVYSEHVNVGERADLVEHAERVAGKMAAFAGELLPREAVDVVYAHDVVDRLLNSTSTKYTPDRVAAAHEAILELATDPAIHAEQARYGLCLLSDMVWTEQASGAHRVDMAARAQDGNGATIPAFTKMIAEQYQGKVSPEAWRRMEPLLDFVHMGKFAGDTNIESLLIKKCELVDNMKYPSSQRESAWLQDALEAESFYAPIAEALGFDGLAAVLRSEAHILRLRGQGMDEYIEKAKETHDAIAAIGVESVVDTILGGSGETCVVAPAVGHDTYSGEVPVHIGEFALQTDSGRCLAGNYRLKTVGSLARKMDKYNGDLPSDVVGLMVISDDVASSARDFADFIQGQFPRFARCIAKSKQTPMYIQGSQTYVRAVEAELRARGIDDILYELKPQSGEEAAENGFGCYEVAKVTLMAEREGTAIPAEVQFITKAERRRSRTGEVAHLIYKYLSHFPDISREERVRIIQQATETLEAMHSRRIHLRADNLGVNERSQVNVEPLLTALSSPSLTHN